ncbi:protein-tyrosine phosphatase-like protein [Suillus paluster]|uniref:protein-tyrosine phosphatase-like protein n=1 Tax=Suillus paluster TaxID=48578 RepID=UPI001B875CA3|nr:protein-tyrosine phosphatase-like protein [Suillus paluster]KAG1738593.1 protein-tyrosine phosphatase-like protein [Suillus paluster]
MSMTWSDVSISIDPIITDNVFIGNLSAALSIDLRKKFGITHVLSVCTEYSSADPNHLTIPVQDSEYEDLLIYLPQGCNFIQSALDQGGKVLVHCVMGVSRSPTVVCAYREFTSLCSLHSLWNAYFGCTLGQVMSTQRLSAHAAIQYVRKRRPEIHPNYGFMKQLITFSECRYKPSRTNGEYIAWKRRQKREVSKYLDLIADTVPVIPDQLYLSSDFPRDPDAAESLLLDLGMTHVLSISSAQLPKPDLPLFNHCFIDIPNNGREALLLELPTACKFIGDAITSGGQVLVQCRVELRACIIVCAYFMFTRHVSPRQALGLLESALPLYNPTDNFYRHLDLFAACNYAPTPNNPLVQAWISGGTQGGKPPLKKKSATSTNNATLSLATTTTTLATEVKVFDFAALSEVLARFQSTSTSVGAGRA